MSTLPKFTRRHEGRLRFNRDTQRYEIGEWELHCGNCFQIKFGSDWLDTRIEMSSGQWYLVGVNVPRLQGVEARSYE